MQVYELDSLAEWFKENVLEIHPAKDDINADDTYGLNISEGAYSEAFENGHTHSDIEQAQQQEQDDELNLIEYIIGIDEIET